MSVPIPPSLCLRPGALDVPVPKVDPTRPDGVAMGSDKFRALPRVPGYKHELIDGTARIRPVDSPLVLLAAPTADLRTRTQPPDQGTVRPLAPDDRDALVTLWADIFVEMPDYGGVDRDDIRADAQEQIDVLLNSPEGPNAMRSRVALRDGTVVGGLLADTFGAVPQIDVLFVAPEAQRRGVGAALLHAFARTVLGPTTSPAPSARPIRPTRRVGSGTAQWDSCHCPVARWFSTSESASAPISPTVTFPPSGAALSRPCSPGLSTGSGMPSARTQPRCTQSSGVVNRLG